LKEQRARRLPLPSGKVGATTLIPALLPLREKGPDGLKHTTRIVHHLLIAEPDHAIAFRVQPGVAEGVMQLRLGQVVPTAIEFDDETPRRCTKSTM
jgi:hypothetical protein